MRLLLSRIAFIHSLTVRVRVCSVSFCLCYAKNVWHTQNFPFLTQLLFYQNGTEYDQLSILNPDYTLNYDKLEQQGLPWYAASQLLFKISRTMYIGAALTHFLLWHGKTVYEIIRDSRVGLVWNGSWSRKADLGECRRRRRMIRTTRR